MSNSLLNIDWITRETLLHLENELVMANLVSRDYESQFAQARKVGDTIRIRRPVRGQVRTGLIRDVQDVEEGNTNLAVATVWGADLDFDLVDLTLKAEDFSMRYLRPQAIAIANAIDIAVHTELANHCPNWQGDPGQVINGFSDFAKGPQLLDELSVPTQDRVAILCPGDNWGLVGSVTSLSADAPVRRALTEARLTRYGGCDIYMSQNVISHTNGSWGSDPQVDDAAYVPATYAGVKTTTYLSSTIHIEGLTANTGTVLAGDAFTIDGVYAVNPVTGETLDFLRPFTVLTGGTADGSGDLDLVVIPAIITVGPYKTVSAAPANDADLNFKGSASTGYRQNLVFHPDAVTLAIVPMQKPRGNAVVSQQTYKGITMMVTEGFDFNNGKSGWRFDVLGGTRAIQPHLATRLSGST